MLIDRHSQTLRKVNMANVQFVENGKQRFLRNEHGGNLEEAQLRRNGWRQNSYFNNAKVGSGTRVLRRKSRSGSPRKRDRSASREDREDSAVCNDFEAQKISEGKCALCGDPANTGSAGESPERGRLGSREEDWDRKTKRWAVVNFGQEKRKLVAS
jgi:hypothetical protein